MKLLIMFFATGKTLVACSKVLGIKEQTLGNWVKERKEKQETEAEVDVEALKKELAKLQHENVELKDENSFLKKASAFFAAQNKNLH